MKNIMSKIDKLLREHIIKSDKKFVMPCPNCGINDAVDCGYGYWDYYGEFDCLAPEEIDVGCEDCYYAWCDECKKKAEVFDILMEEDFII